MEDDNWKLDIWNNRNVTPGTAIINFENNATPVDSPDAEELLNIVPLSVSNIFKCY